MLRTESRETGSRTVRLRILARGLVQGVGFRPFVHRLATELELRGFVRNSASGAWIEVEGGSAGVGEFRHRFESECPPPAKVLHREETWLDAEGTRGFEIVPSDSQGPRTAWVLPDLATCPECVAEIFDPSARRHRYPFTNCTHCGPRYTILEAMPYDRERTSMREFVLCPKCRAEFEDPGDRRFHAQPIACPDCGPRLRALDATGAATGAEADAALREAVRLVREGGILALKGLGGYQLVVRADDEAAVARLRARKNREAKPFALMLGSVAEAERCVAMSEADRRLLTSSAAPIVLLPRRSVDGVAEGWRICESVAPGCPWLGVMLPYTPLHHLLLADLGLPLVATSGNRSDEPICLNESEAVERLAGIADAFLVHDRRIVRQVDDSVARCIDGREQLLRRARGYAPLPLQLPSNRVAPVPLLAVGAHLKNSVAVVRGAEVFPSQHVGDLETESAVGAFVRVANDLPRLLEAQPGWMAADLHPDYSSTQYAEASGLPVVSVPHHEAHVWSCLADNSLEPPVLALSWDGTGLGPDRTLWGGEFLELCGETWECRRRAWLRPFPLPGGDAVAREPRRSWLGLLFEGCGGDRSRLISGARSLFEETEFEALLGLMRRGVQSPRTSSMGRLFDAVAAGLGVAGRSRFEGEAAMRLEWAAWRALSAPVREGGITDGSAGFSVVSTSAGWVLDWAPWVEGCLLGTRTAGVDHLALQFHEALVQGTAEIVRRVGHSRVLLTGGCFQNRWLTERLLEVLRGSGFSVYCHQRVPPNDGGLAVGQAMAAVVRALQAPQADRPMATSPQACVSPFPAKS